MSLTAKEVQEAKPRSKRYLLPDGDGLVLEVMTSGSKIWRFRDQRGGREVKVTLGKYPYLSLQGAREKRHELKKAQIDGRNIQEALNPPKTPVFEDLAGEWYTRNMEGKKNGRYLKDIRRMLNHYLLPALGARPIADITAPELLQTIHGIEDKGYTVLAHRVKQIAGQVLQYAVLTGNAPHNVAADLRGALQPVRHEHYPSLTAPKDIAELMRKIRAYASTNLNAQGVDKELVEIQLSHRDEDHVRAAYNFADRLPERKVMMQNWADWLDSLDLLYK